MPEVFGALPHPKVLVMGYDDEGDRIAEELRAIAPTVRLIGNLSEVRQAEWDFLVTAEDVPKKTARHISVLVEEATSLGIPEDAEGMRDPGNQLCRRWSTKSREFVLGSDLPAQIEALARRDLIPLVQELGANDSLYTVREEDHLGSVPVPRETPRAFQAFVLTTEGYALAGRFTRKGGEAECWSVPAGANIVEWARVALDELSRRDPTRFPPKSEWASDRRWWTPEEQSVAATVEDLQHRLSEVVSALERDVATAQASLEQAHSRAAQRERRLLAAQSADLVEVVIDCLRDLGYEVRVMDDEASPGDKLEDLRISDPDAEDWQAIVEVRGYKRGAQVSDLFRLVRFSARFAQEEGLRPKRMWYVVNQFIEDDPAGRQRALAGNSNEVDIFQEDGGLVVESTDLFRLWMDVRRGVVAPEVARKTLTNETGRLSYP